MLCKLAVNAEGLSKNVNKTIPSDYKDYYNRSSCWGKTYHAVNEHRAKETIQMIPDDVQSILDVGCGDGIITNKLKKDCFTVGADISEEALKYIQRHKISVNIALMPFRDSSFDCVIANEVIEHLPVPVYKDSLNELERVAKRYILISVPYEEILELSYARCPGCGCIFHGAKHARGYSRNDMSHLFTNFKMETFKLIGKNPEKATRLELFIRQKLGGDYYYISENAVCPVCQNTVTTRPPRTVFSYIAAALRRTYGIFVREKPMWASALFNKID